MYISVKSLDWFVWKSWNLFACFAMEFVPFFLFKHESFKDILGEMLRMEGRKEGNTSVCNGTIVWRVKNGFDLF